MKERGIIFSGPMVRAIFENRKAVTRRVVKLYGSETIAERDDNGTLWPWSVQHDLWIACPYGVPGDRLWVLETWAKAGGRYVYRADVNDGAEEASVRRIAPELAKAHPWRASICMPRVASRLALEVVSVRVERLHQITDDECEREGIVEFPQGPMDCRWGVFGCGPDDRLVGPRQAFMNAWDQIKGLGAWTLNPWVWVIEFRRINE